VLVIHTHTTLNQSSDSQLLVNFVQYTWLECRLLTGPCHWKFMKHRVKQDLG